MNRQRADQDPDGGSGGNPTECGSSDRGAASDVEPEFGQRFKTTELPFYVFFISIIILFVEYNVY